MFVAMHMSKTRSLIIVAVALSLLMPVVRELRFAGLLTLNAQLVIAYAAFGLTIATAIMGLWTPFRRSWLSYLALTIACMLLFGSLPLSTASMLVNLAIRHIIA